MKKLCFLLAVLMMAGSCACAEKTQDDTAKSTDTQSEVQTEAVETSAFSTVPKTDFEGKKVRMISSPDSGRQVDIVAEEADGSLLNDMVFERNSKIEELYSVDLEASAHGGSGVSDLVKQGVLADDVMYELYFGNALAGTMSVMVEGYLYPLDELPVLNLENPWWDKYAVEGLSMGGKQYMATGDISPTSLLISESLLFNKKLLSDRNIEYPYDTVFDGKWTWDAFLALTKDLGEDLDGDSKINPKEDRMVYTGWHYDVCDAMFYGAGGTYSKKNEDDFPELNFELEKFDNIYQKIGQLTNNEYCYVAVGNENHELTFKIFAEGRSYFCGIQFWKVDRFLRDMQDDFGVLPEPKYDENQERYMTSVQDHCPMILVQNNLIDTELVGTMMEAIAALNYDTISPKMYDVVAGTRNVRDEESARVVNMIIRNRVFDIGMYLLDDYSRMLIVDRKCSNIASFMAAQEKKAVKVLEKYSSIRIDG